MLRNFLITTLRVLYRNKGFTAINILGLAIGFACCIFIALYINHEVSFDRFHRNSDRIYRVTTSFIRNNVIEERMGSTSPKVGEDLLDEIPEVEKVLRLMQTGGQYRYGDREVSSGTLFYADTTLWDFLDFKLLHGDASSALREPFSIVLSQRLAHSIFGDNDPMGQVVIGDGKTPFTVTGIVEDCPTNTRLQHNGFISFSTLYNITTGTMREWDGNIGFITLLMLAPGSNRDEVITKANRVADMIINKKMEAYNFRYEVGLQALRDIHLYNDLEYDKPGVSTILYIIAAIASFILFIAGFNFVNLSTARSTRRAKEVGMRMSVGASKGQVRWQFIGESLLLVLFRRS